MGFFSPAWLPTYSMIVDLLDEASLLIPSSFPLLDDCCIRNVEVQHIIELL